MQEKAGLSHRQWVASNACLLYTPVSAPQDCPYIPGPPSCFQGILHLTCCAPKALVYTGGERIGVPQAQAFVRFQAGCDPSDLSTLNPRAWQYLHRVAPLCQSRPTLESLMLPWECDGTVCNAFAKAKTGVVFRADTPMSLPPKLEDSRPEK
eukprot:scaffold230781_cov45-Prasinocladus_malaysianus.AAC.1